jgi:hypothetical protein
MKTSREPISFHRPAFSRLISTVQIRVDDAAKLTHTRPPHCVTGTHDVRRIFWPRLCRRPDAARRSARALTPWRAQRATLPPQARSSSKPRKVFSNNRLAVPSRIASIAACHVGKRSHQHPHRSRGISAARPVRPNQLQPVTARYAHVRRRRSRTLRIRETYERDPGATMRIRQSDSRAVAHSR